MAVDPTFQQPPGGLHGDAFVASFRVTETTTMTKTIGFALALLLSACAGPQLSAKGATVKTIVGEPPSDCVNRGAVAGGRGAFGGPEDQAGLNRIFNAAADLGANAVLFRSASDAEFKGTALACADLAKARIVSVTVPGRFTTEGVAKSCVEVGIVESRVAMNQVELREILAARAAGMGANTLKLETTGARPYAGNITLVTGSAATWFCPKD
jgi:hypothetical protein